MWRCLVGIAAASLLAWGSAATAEDADPGPVRVGDRWSYDVKDDATGDLRHSVTFVVVEVTDKEITARLTAKGKDRPRTYVFDPDWGRIDDSVWRYRPSDIGIRKPLQVGKEWRIDANASNMQNGTTLRVSGVAKVVGKEQIATPAGTFDTFRVEAKLREVNSRDQTKSAMVTQVFWYVPGVNRWAKRKVELRVEGRLRDSYSEELTEYSRKL